MTLALDHLCAVAILSALCLAAVAASGDHSDRCGRELDYFRQQHGDLTKPNGEWLAQKLREAQRLCQDGDGLRALQLLDKTSEDLRYKRADPPRARGQDTE